MARISRRVSAVAESATLAIDAKAKALKAAGEDVIGFGAGEPDFPTPDHIVGRGRGGLPGPAEPQVHARPAGLPELRQAIAAKTARDSGYPVAAGQVLVTNGGKQAVEEAFATLLDPGDEVLAPGAVLDDLPRDASGWPGRPSVELPTTAADRVSGHGRAARGGPDAEDQDAAVRLAVQPDRRRLPPRRDRGRSAGGRSSTGCGC